MWRDPIVEEVRKTREEIFARFGNDLSRYVKFLQTKQAATGKTKGGAKSKAKGRAGAHTSKEKNRKPTGKRRAA